MVGQERMRREGIIIEGYGSWNCFYKIGITYTGLTGFTYW